MKKAIKTHLLFLLTTACIFIPEYSSSFDSSLSNEYYNDPGAVFEPYDIAGTTIPDDSEYIFDKNNVYDSQLPVEPEDTEESFPEYYDLRDFGIVSPVRQQGSYGTCWAISALGSMETQIMKSGFDSAPVLSSWHLSYFSYKGNKPFTTSSKSPYLSGGMNTTACATLSKWNGPISESIVPYDSWEIVDSNLQNVHEYELEDVYNIHPWLEAHQRYTDNSIKKLIYEKNAVSVYINADEQYYNSGTCSQYCYDNTDVNHGVLAVGWDDNYPKENFSTKPHNDGAWLIKNSWGTNWGDNGYFWLSYDDISLHEAACYFCEPEGTYKNNYYYDDHGWITSISTNSRQTSLSGYMSNIFTAADNEDISAVSFYTIEPDADYEIFVYTDLSNSKSPVGKTVSQTTSGTEEYKGYHTVRLNKPVSVSEGELFSVVVKITNKYSPYTVPIEASIYATIGNSKFANISMSILAEDTTPMTSYISNDGISWTDTANRTYLYKNKKYFTLDSADEVIDYVLLGNICVKAFSTQNDKPDILEGDINSDGYVNVADAVILMRYLNNTSDEAENFNELNADLNSSGTIDILDLILLKGTLVN
ncbi:MAG: lectin like domain-containing protein [Oscillospiraceae bacterium]|nr:lectin like domain-containing protein [Oscillospiraceae bacterium]